MALAAPQPNTGTWYVELLYFPGTVGHLAISIKSPVPGYQYANLYFSFGSRVDGIPDIKGDEEAYGRSTAIPIFHSININPLLDLLPLNEKVMALTDAATGTAIGFGLASNNCADNAIKALNILFGTKACSSFGSLVSIPISVAQNAIPFALQQNAILRKQILSDPHPKNEVVQAFKLIGSEIRRLEILRAEIALTKMTFARPEEIQIKIDSLTKLLGDIRRYAEKIARLDPDKQLEIIDQNKRECFSLIKHELENHSAVSTRALLVACLRQFPKLEYGSTDPKRVFVNGIQKTIEAHMKDWSFEGKELPVLGLKTILTDEIQLLEADGNLSSCKVPKTIFECYQASLKQGPPERVLIELRRLLVSKIASLDLLPPDWKTNPNARILKLDEANWNKPTHFRTAKLYCELYNIAADGLSLQHEVSSTRRVAELLSDVPRAPAVGVDADASAESKEQSAPDDDDHKADEQTAFWENPTRARRDAMQVESSPSVLIIPPGQQLTK